MKPLVSTRTFWLAVAQAVVAVLVIFTTTYPDAHWAGYMLIVKSIIDMILRSDTSIPVGSILPK